MHSALEKRFSIDGKELFVTASIGIALGARFEFIPIAEETGLISGLGSTSSASH